MAHPPPYPDSGGDAGDGSDDTRLGFERGSDPAGTPRWVKVFGIVALVLILLFFVLQVFGGGGHGPGRHAGGASEGAPLARPS